MELTAADRVLEEDEGFPPLHSDFGPAIFVPYVLDLAALGFGSAHVTQCIALLVLARRDGVLLAMPESAMPVLRDTADHTSLVGHLKAEFDAAVLNSKPSWWTSIQISCNV